MPGTSEQELVARMRELAGRLTGFLPARGPAVATAVATEEAPRPADVVREVALRLGLTEADISACYASQESYAWCLALLDVSTTPPAAPFPADLVHLLLRLLSLGRIDYGRVRLLGLDRVLLRLVAGRLGNAVRVAVELARGGLAYGRHVITEEVAKARRLFEAASRVAEPRALEEVVARVRAVAPGVPEELIMKALVGRESPAEVAEEMVLAARRAVAPTAEERPVKEGGRAVAPSPEERGPARIQTPRGE